MLSKLLSILLSASPIVSRSPSIEVAHEVNKVSEPQAASNKPVRTNRSARFFISRQHAPIPPRGAIKIWIIPDLRVEAMIRAADNLPAFRSRGAILRQTMHRAFFIFLFSSIAGFAADFNDVVLAQVAKMPKGGGYAATTAAHQALASSVQIGPDCVRIRAESARPSYCSGATYLVFLKTLGELQKRGSAILGPDQWRALLPSPVPDGEGVWGRWNANGPGTPRLFYQLGLGRNFTSFEEAKPGDFMKIFWTDAVGSNERGHSTIFLGTEMRDGVECVRFWSSNKPEGYGEKSVPRARIARAIFSRLESPGGLSALGSLTGRDIYLASLLDRPSSFGEAVRMSGAR